MHRRSFLACLASALAVAASAPLSVPGAAQRWTPPEGNFIQNFNRGARRRAKRGAGGDQGPGGPGMRMRRKRRMMMMRRRRMMMQRRGNQ